MAGSRLATVTTNPLTVLSADGNFNHTVDANTKIVLLFVALEGIEAINPTPVWDAATANETFVIVRDTGAQVDNGDMRLYVYGIVNPTAKTAQISLDWDGSADPAWAGAINYDGIITTSVANAALFITDDVNNAVSTQSIHASGGTAGNVLIWFGAGQGFDMSPMAQTAGTTFTEIVDEETGGSGVADFGVGVFELINSAPSAITVDYGANDENASIFLQLVASSTGSIINQLQGSNLGADLYNGSIQ